MLLLLTSAVKIKDLSHILDIGHGASRRKASRSQNWIQAGHIKSRGPVIYQPLMPRTHLAMFWVRLGSLIQVLGGLLQHTHMLYVSWQLQTGNNKPTDVRAAAVASWACGNPAKKWQWAIACQHGTKSPSPLNVWGSIIPGLCYLRGQDCSETMNQKLHLWQMHNIWVKNLLMCPKKLDGGGADRSW